MGAEETSNWFPYHLVGAAGGGADITNQFVSDGINAGLIGLFLSVLLVVRCFQKLGCAIDSVRGIEPAAEKILWGLGATFTGSIAILFSVTYFDQMHVFWYFFLACISTVTASVTENSISLSSSNDHSFGEPIPFRERSLAYRMQE